MIRIVPVIFCTIIIAACSDGTKVEEDRTAKNEINQISVEVEETENELEESIKPSELPECISQIMAPETAAAIINASGSYEDLRPKILDKGFSPDQTKGLQMCFGEPDDWGVMASDICPTYPEASNCWGTGMGGCEFIWSRDDVTIYVRTHGEEIPGYIVGLGCETSED